MIDLRSDTVTRPTRAMREAMATAVVGDDVYGEDPTVLELEARVAADLGKEAAMFVPTGTMSNQLALRTHTEPGDLILMDRGSHIVLNEGGGAAALSGLTIRGLDGKNGIFSAAEVEAQFEPPHRFNPGHLMPSPRLLCVENTHNVGGGVIWPLEELRAVTDVARTRGLVTHLDGARIWHATAGSGIEERVFAEPFDTISVCFSKGLGAPVGSALVGSEPLIARARRFKQQYGGGFRQAGILAAGALFALDHHRERLGDDLVHARRLAEGLAELDGVDIDVRRVQTNIVRFQVTAMRAGDFVDGCFERGVHLLPGGEHGVRAVTHLDVGAEDVLTALAVMADVLAGA
ncbi:MAG: aminotransferase class I/II-fold pyridoxal phosphate-dependent enzyme [Gemmatimonadota bacterium]|nr:aminotransferase class I/II-fold pyridoxal phosphate-dependent enzyme [Gemmatimonadota bacterium]MDH5758447.1 aminotransferase class I/II-fold pyridoxal phosphate-dependent enzyme [Gemmatimonadota bacterium]